MPERLMKIDEVARYFSVNQRTIRRLWDRGEFPKPIRIGKMLRWREQALAEYVNDKCEQAQHEPAVH
jgi:excisionase family DNA binding protein